MVFPARSGWKNLRQLDASTGASGPHDLMSSRFFGLLKTS
jgi:hypothetical protein